VSYSRLSLLFPYTTLFRSGTALQDIAVLHGPTDLGDNGGRVRIPFGDQGAGLDLVALAFQQLGAIDQRIALAFALATGAGVAYRDRKGTHLNSSHQITSYA